MASPTRSSTSDDGNNETQQPPTLTSLLRGILSPLLTPLQAVLDFISSPAFLRASISTLLFFLVSSILLAVSTTAYLFFYYAYIPPISLSLPLYLQYGVHPASVPYAVTDIPLGTLVASQPYEVTVDLEMPRTPTNLEAGVFMVDVRLLGVFDPLAEPPETLKELLGNITSLAGDSQTVLQHSRRPNMLKYRSRLLNLAWQVAYLPLHLLGARDLDTESVKVRLWEAAVFKRGASNMPRTVRVEIAAGGTSTGLSETNGVRQIQVYKASVTFAARFRGLRYVVYNYRTLSFVVFTAVFYVVSIITMGLVWAWIGPAILSPPSNAVIKQEDRGVATKKIKTEDEDTEATTKGFKLEDVSDTPAQFPSGRGRLPLRYEGLQDEQEVAGPIESNVRDGEKADDEDEDDDFVRAQASSTGRFEGDSGIGTMSEGTRSAAGLVRRRSGKEATGRA